MNTSPRLRRCTPLSKSRILRLSFLVGLVLAFPSLPATAQTETAPAETGQTETGQTEPSITELKKNYTESIAALRQSIKDLKRAGLEYYFGKSDTSLKFKSQWEAAAVAGTQNYENVQKNAFALFLAVERPEEQLTRVVYRLNSKYFEEGRIQTNYLVTRKLYSMFPDDSKIQIDMAKVAVLANDFELARQLSKTINIDNPAFTAIERSLWQVKDSLALERAREIKLQSAEAKADDLPRVELITTKGRVVIELFENEAPETVGNFINLVEAGFYDEILFNFVLKQLTAVTGGISIERPQPVGYQIYDESERADARYHFRGTVAMFTDGKTKNSGASMFFFNLVPAPFERHYQTVFGRVISGMDVIEQLQVTTVPQDDGETKTLDDIMWDKIISAKVLRKRDHEYIPHIVKD